MKNPPIGSENLRVLVCGDRRYTHYMMINATLDGFLLNYPKMVLIEGFAKGADMIAHDWGVANLAEENHLTFPADWGALGKSAGPIRNQKMLDEGKPDIVLAFHNNIKDSKGTKHMVEIATKAGVSVHLIAKQYSPNTMPNLAAVGPPPARQKWVQ
jgi:YspA, cpYpsA-related SLOG family